ncbi:MAG: Unknown protein [uncultured Sulfurovum sp.]|uniref:Uncharacterized protein n=1 Tax=uncultured Sulfurovum sp. TaxID=269237 RepID=A0A6S6U5Y3_9BACT|nr:MAG: Unknown protein [uncultured Sulfurovum sp.]
MDIERSRNGRAHPPLMLRQAQQPLQKTHSVIPAEAGIPKKKKQSLKTPFSYKTQKKKYRTLSGELP